MAFQLHLMFFTNFLLELFSSEGYILHHAYTILVNAVFTILFPVLAFHQYTPVSITIISIIYNYYNIPMSPFYEWKISNVKCTCVVVQKL